MPTVKGSMLPGLLGLNSLVNRRAILDCITKRLHFLGPGDYDLQSALPPGSKTYQLETAPSGHLILPCTRYAASDQQQKNGAFKLDQTTVTLAAVQEQ